MVTPLGSPQLLPAQQPLGPAKPAPGASSLPQTPPAPPGANLGGFLPMVSAAKMLEQARAQAEAAAQAQQAQPVIQGLAGYIANFFTTARMAREPVERAMLEAVYARRGEYTPSQKAELIAQNQPLIYMMLFSVKCRQAESLLRDVLMGTGKEKPWTLRPTPDPELPLQETATILQGVAQEVYQAQMMGLMMSIEDIKQRLRDARTQMEGRLMEEAMARCERMENKMEDQLLEGGFQKALDQFISDLTTFKTAFIAGPVVRRKPRLKWMPDGSLQVVRELKLEWERVDPFSIYPAPWATDLQVDPFVRRHKLTRAALNDLIGVPGYSDAAIRKVLYQYDHGHTHTWLTIDAEKASAEGRDQLSATTGTDLIDALQYFGTASGKLLREWGLPAEQVPDETKEYEIEAWLVGDTVIKAVLNPDPLCRRPIYHHSYERVPGTIWGNSMYDLMADCQAMCNAAARALATNMAIASGPQVVVFTDRMAPGAKFSNIYPWKIWQATSDPGGSTARPVDFFQPQSNAPELMGIFERFSLLADEYTGIPRYMTGTEGTRGGIGRTASGLSMMIGNASKIIKSVIGGIDVYIIQRTLEALFFHNMMYGDDPDLKGDVQIVARGALSLTAKEAAAVRRNEFLVATANPIDMQIIGLEGRAELLREQAKLLDMDTDRVVPPISVIRQRAAQAMMAQAMLAQQQGGQGGKPKKPGSGQELMNGAPVEDQFQPA